jgi:hypothetical protein
MGHGVEFVTSYTFSKTLTDNRGFYGGGTFISGEGAYWQNAYNRESERGRSFFDATHNFSVGGTWKLPVPAMHGIAGAVLSGWNTGFLMLAHSGFPVTMIGRDNTNQAVRGNVRPNRYRTLTYQNQTVDNWFGTGNTFCASGVDDGKCAYGDAGPGLFGNSAIGTERAPSYFNFDATAGKSFKISEKKRVDFRAEFFNLMNHPSFGPPGRSLASPATLGQITTQTTLPRNIQFGAKFYF